MLGYFFLHIFQPLARWLIVLRSLRISAWWDEGFLGQFADNEGDSKKEEYEWKTSNAWNMKWPESQTQLEIGDDGKPIPCPFPAKIAKNVTIQAQAPTTSRILQEIIRWTRYLIKEGKAPHPVLAKPVMRHAGARGMKVILL